MSDQASGDAASDSPATAPATSTTTAPTDTPVAGPAEPVELTQTATGADLDPAEEPEARRPQPPRPSEPRRPQKVSVAWAPLEAALAKVLAALDDEQFLVIEAKHTNRFVQFSARGAVGLRAEAVGNRFLPAAAQLDSAAIDRLHALGWHDATHTREQEGTPEADPDGSVNYFADWPAPPPCAEVAAMATRTLREVYGVSHPAWLEYRAFDLDGERILLPTLGINRVKDEPEHDEIHPWVGLPPGADMRSAVMQTMKVLLNVEELVVDDDGDIPVRHGTAAIYVRAIDDPATIIVFSPLLFDVEPTPELYVELNERNSRTYFARFLFVGNTVMLSAETFGDPFVADDVVNSYLVVSELAAKANQELHERFGGTLVFDDRSSDEASKKASPPPPAPGAGGYL